MTSLWEDPQSHFPENLMADLKHPIWGFTENLGVIASLARRWWLTSVIIATQEAEIRRTEV
jgi:hypothetical protein